MNMLSSLKALLFSSAAPGTVTAQPIATGDGMDFAAMLNGSMVQDATAAAAVPQIAGADAPAPSLQLSPEGDPSVPTAAPVVDFAAVADSAPVSPAAHDHVPPGLAVAVAAGKGVPGAIPPGLALGLVKHAAAPALSDPVEAEAAPAASPETPVQPQPAPDAELTEAAAPPAKPRAADGKPKAAPNVPATLTAAEASVSEAVPTEAKPVRKEKAKAEKAEQSAVVDAPLQQPLSVVMPTVTITADAAVPPVASQPEMTIGVEPSSVMTGAFPLSHAPPLDPSAPAPKAASAPRQEALPRQGDAKAPQVTSDQLAATVGQDTPKADIPQPAAPALNGKPVKAEALALLQIVREQVASRQSGATSVRVGEQVSAAARVKGERSVPGAEAAPDQALPIPPMDIAPSPSTAASAPAVSPFTAPSAPIADLSASLGAQVVDMGVSGQWIDGLARDIAGLSANGAQGRFQIDTQHLGAVQVDIRHDTDGAAVSLTVASEAAEAALRQDSDRLKLDAGLAAVRISEVKVERAMPVAEAHRADMGGQSFSQQQQSQQGSQTASAWQQNNGQNTGQPQGQQNRWQGRENNGFGPKGSGDPAVLNHADPQPAAHDRARARYA